MKLKALLLVQRYVPIAVRELIARTAGCFWKECENCGEYYGGHEIADDFVGWTKLAEMRLSEQAINDGVSFMEKANSVCPRCSQMQLSEIKFRAIKVLESQNFDHREISALVKIDAEDIDHRNGTVK